MKGTEKQIKWAEETKTSKNFEQFLGKGRNDESNTIIAKAVEYVNSIDEAAFWIEYRDYESSLILNNLMTKGLLIRGLSFGDRAVLSPATGEVTITIHKPSWQQ